jgi:pyridoxal phosphate enzyme (YggS family)
VSGHKSGQPPTAFFSAIASFGHRPTTNGQRFTPFETLNQNISLICNSAKSGTMAVNVVKYKQIKEELGDKVKLVACSKDKTVEEIKLLHKLGQRDFGEDNVHALAAKQMSLPGDIRWHFTGQLANIKVKYIIPFVHTVHCINSFNLLEEIDRQAGHQKRKVHCLLQVNITQEHPKCGLDKAELASFLDAIPKYKLMDKLHNIKITGMCGTPSATDNKEQVRKEYKYLRCLFDDSKDETGQLTFKTICMGNDTDFRIAIEEGSNMVFLNRHFYLKNISLKGPLF